MPYHFVFHSSWAGCSSIPAQRLIYNLTMLTLNQLAPDFLLLDLDGTLHSLRNYRGRVVVLNFWSAECPHAARTDAQLVANQKTWGSKVVLISVASNANEPPELLRQVANQEGLTLILLDQGSDVADRYGAITTPHLFVIDEKGILRYQGAFDDINFRKRSATKHYLYDAVEAILAGALPNPAETPPYGCAIVRHVI